jgi:lipopolysaccharide transport system ATP-binding protein
VAFAEVEKFIDTPVKHYSSGMYLRLAFAVAAHLEPEIVIVDEVLAVGDARFQKKCLNKMQDVGKQGRTVLFVSHNMPAITRLCERTILLDGGRVLSDGPSSQVVSDYLNSGFGTSAEREWPDDELAPGADVARLRAVRVRSEDGQTTDAVDIRRPFAIEMEYETIQSGYTLLPLHHIHNEEGIHVLSTHDLDPDWRGRFRPAGRWVSTVWIPANFMSEGTFFVSSEAITLQPNMAQFHERDVVAFQVIDSLDGNSARGDWTGRMGGVVRPLLTWSNRFSPIGHPVSTK